MDLHEHLDGLRQAMVAFVRHVERAGLRAPVPTAPAWRTRRLVAHQGLVHRWARAELTGADLDHERTEAEAMNSDDPVDWLRDGALELATTLVRGDVHPDASVFLADAPPPREFWARRQCHETTIHAVDALAASLGRVPGAEDAPWITPEVALDGIDELLTGFVPRPRTTWRADASTTYVVAPADSDRAWVVEVGAGVPLARRVTAAEAPAGDVRLEQPAVAAYLALWNRGPLPPEWAGFAGQVRIEWSA